MKYSHTEQHIEEPLVGVFYLSKGKPLYFTASRYTMSMGAVGEATGIELEGFLINGNDIDIAKKFIPQMKQVIFSQPATIVYWDDGTRTVVKCQEGDEYDEKVGLALCFLKKFTGNKSRTLEEIAEGKCYRGKSTVHDGSDNQCDHGDNEV